MYPALRSKYERVCEKCGMVYSEFEVPPHKCKQIGDTSMTPEAQKALELSILHWKAILAGKDVSLGTKNCPLCHEFFLTPQGRCIGCPVSEKTGKAFCDDSPYIKFSRIATKFAEIGVANVGLSYGPINSSTPGEVIEAIRDELDFLISLHPGPQWWEYSKFLETPFELPMVNWFHIPALDAADTGFQTSVLICIAVLGKPKTIQEFISKMKEFDGAYDLEWVEPWEMFAEKHRAMKFLDS